MSPAPRPGPGARRCFVISPIGPEGSEIRQHADDVFEFVIAPAMRECGVVPLRSDHLREPGRISQQMIDAILGYDLCIAVLTGRNANVLYELAIAQCAERPVILLLHKGEELPFDVRDLRVVEYDLKPRPLREQVYERAIVEHYRALEASGWRVPTLLGGGAVGQAREPVGMPDDLRRSIPVRERSIGTRQRQILRWIERHAERDESVGQGQVAARFEQPATETYYRLEQLRLLGFLTKRWTDEGREFRYGLSAAYRAHLQMPPAADRP